MEKTDLLERWENLKKEDLKDFSLEFQNYSSKTIMQLMKVALLFWKFVRNELRTYYSDADQIEFLLHFVKNENKNIALIARIELLPTNIWRKCLWAYNIDFLSYESFLRRITLDQRRSIIANYIDSLTFTRYRVLSYRLIDKLLLIVYSILKVLGMKNYLNKAVKEMYSGKRYLSKSAWADNLAFLDFGFGKYPEGKLSDVEIKNSKASRFLSVKNHVNDFVVNQENGVYWFFYRFTRSFGGVTDMNSVTLNSWICPGFWMTLLMMMWFLIGPIIGLFIVDYSTFSFPTILTLILTAPFTLWIVVHFGIKLARTFILLGEKMKTEKSNRFGNKLLQFFRPVFYISGLIIIIGLFTLIGDILLELRDFINRLFMKINLFDPLIGLIILSVVSLYLIGSLLHWFAYENLDDDGELSSSMIQNGSVRKASMINLLFWTISIVMLFREKVWLVITSLGKDMWSGLSWFGLLLFENALPISLILMLIISNFYIIKIVVFSDDEKFHKKKKKVYFSLFVSVISLISLLSPSFQETTVAGGLIIFSPILFGILFFLVLILIFSTTQRSIIVTKEVIGKKATIRNLVNSNYFSDMDEKYGINANLYKRLLIQNNNLDKNNLDSTLELSREVISFLSLIGRDKFIFLKFILKSMKHERISELHEILLSEGNVIRNNFTQEFKNEDRSLTIFSKLFLKGHSKEESIKLTRDFFSKELKTSKKRKVRLHKISIILARLATPFVWFFMKIKLVSITILNTFMWMVKSIGKILKNLYRFWKIMSKEACPYVGEQKYLD